MLKMHAIRLRLCYTHQFPIFGKVQSILIPQFTIFTLNGFLDQFGEYLADVGDMHVAPDALSLSNLEPGTTLKSCFCRLWDLHAALVDGSSAAAIDQWREHQGCLGTIRGIGQVEEKAIDKALGGIALDELADFFDSVVVVVYLVGGLAVCVFLDVWEGKEGCA